MIFNLSFNARSQIAAILLCIYCKLICYLSLLINADAQSYLCKSNRFLHHFTHVLLSPYGPRTRVFSCIQSCFWSCFKATEFFLNFRRRCFINLRRSFLKIEKWISHSFFASVILFYIRCDEFFKILRFQTKSEAGAQLSLLLYFFIRCDDCFKILRFQTKSEAASTSRLNAVVVLLLYIIKWKVKQHLHYTWMLLLWYFLILNLSIFLKS